MADPKTIEAMLDERRTFPPPREFKSRATVRDDAAYREAAADLEGFWAKLEWSRKWDTVLEWKAPWAKWFVGGKLNVSHNCLDRHVAAGRGDRIAYRWLGEND